jgi:hypothetical protein
MKFSPILILLSLLIGTNGCETIDSPYPSKNSSIPIVDNSVDSTREVPVLKYGVGIESGDYGLSWKDCSGVKKYELEETSFLWGTRIVYSGLGLSYDVGIVKSDSPLVYRLRANYGEKYSMWSNSVYLPHF